jgi:hypothetical protein
MSLDHEESPTIAARKRQAVGFVIATLAIADDVAW